VSWIDSIRKFFGGKVQSGPVSSITAALRAGSPTVTIKTKLKLTTGDRIRMGEEPPNSKVGTLDLTGLDNAARLPNSMECHTLIWHNAPFEELPTNLRVRHKLDLSGSVHLKQLPRGLRVSVLVLRGCTSLEALPEEMRVDFLDVSDCRALREWPESAQVSIGSVTARNCVGLRQLPERLGRLTSLDLRGCEALGRIPIGVQVGSWIDIGGTRIVSLPEPLTRIGLRWRGVAITPQIAFFPETLKVEDVLAERNAEVRRVMIERVGFDRFLKEAKAEVLDTDQDAGGERKLLRVALQGDEPLVGVSVHCPSTGRHYLIRVPPETKTCREAVAWTAGFDDAHLYKPVQET